VWLAATIAFLLLHLAPGDPVSTMLESPLIPEEVRVQWRAMLGLDRPLLEQYGRWIGGVVRGDLGWSVWRRAPVRTVLAEAIPRTVLLMATGLVLAFAGGIALGARQAMRHDSRFDRIASTLALAVRAMPEFLLALLLFALFTWRVPLFPPGGMIDPVGHELLSPLGRIGDRLMHLALPALTIGLTGAATIARFQRAAMLDALRQDFVRTARAKGGSDAIVRRHALRNALQPTVAVLGLALPALFGGAFFVEAVFMWPGVGTLAVGAIAARDYALVSAIVVVGAALVALGSLLADLLAAWLDPRLRT